MPADSNRQSVITTASKKASYSRKEVDPNEQRFIQDIYAMIFLAVITLLVLGQVIWHPFIDFDDDVYVFANKAVTEGLSPKNTVWAFKTFDMGHWHPITWISLMLDRQFFGMRAGGYHFVNLFIHVFSTLLLFKFLRRVTDAFYPSVAVALLFAIHPLHVEPVAWIASRKDVLSGFFFMLSLLAYHRYSQDSKSWKKYLLVCLMLLLGLMSKSMLITLPFLLLLIDYWPLNRYQQVIDQGYQAILKTFLRFSLEKLPMFMIAVAFAITAYFADQKQRTLLQAERQLGNQNLENVTPTFLQTLHKSVYALIYYIGKLFLPTDLGIYYPTVSNISLPLLLFSIFVLVAISILVLIRWRRSPYLLVGWYWYLGMILPTIRLQLADRYTYLPYIGLFILIVWFIKEDLSGWSFQPILVKWVGGPALVLMALCAFVQVDYWQDSVTIFQRTISVTSDNNKIHMLLAQSYFRLGKFDESIKEYQEVLRLKPQYAEVYYNLGQIKLKQGKVDEAISQFNESLKINPNLAKSHYVLAGILSKQGKQQESIPHLAEAMRLQPDLFSSNGK